MPIQVIDSLSMVGEKGEILNKFGYNPQIDTGTDPEDVWTTGGLYPTDTFLTPQSLEVLSASANDANPGTGANAIGIAGTGPNLEFRTTVVFLNGITPVAIDGTWTSVNRMAVISAGAVGANAGQITVRVAGGGTTVSSIPFRVALTGNANGKGQTEQAVYRVAANKQLMIKRIVATIEDATNTQAAVEIVNVNIDTGVTRTLGSFFVTENNPLRRTYSIGGPHFSEGEFAIIRVREVSSNGVIISAEFDAIEYPFQRN